MASIENEGSDKGDEDRNPPLPSKAPRESAELLKGYVSDCQTVWERVQPSVLLEKAFERHGRIVSSHPWPFVVMCLAVTAAASIGLTMFKFQTNIIQLWSPMHSDTAENFRWLWKNHPPDMRRHEVIFKADNVLDIQSIRKMFDVRKQVYSMRTPDHNYSWFDVCMKVPVIPSSLRSDVHSTEESGLFGDNDDNFDDFSDSGMDPIVPEYPDPFCFIYNTLPRRCFEDSILELFGQDGDITEEQVDQLTNERVLDTLNDKNISGMFSTEKNFKDMLGDVRYNEEGKIISAGVITYILYGKMNVTGLHRNKGQGSSMFGEQLSLEVLSDKTNEVENALIELFNKQRESSMNGFSLEYYVVKSLQQSMNETILADLPKVFCSFLLMFVYVSFSLGSLNCMENRILLTQAGLFTVLLGLLTSYGLCSYLGFIVSPLHNFIPFLLLGVGIDDMFIITNAYDQYGAKQSGDLPAKMAETMKHSGVAITVTSLTDFLAFVIGSSTKIPALKSFCLYCGIGIVCIYLYQVTWFVAWLSLDERRRMARRYALIPCMKSSDDGEAVENGNNRFKSYWRCSLAKQCGKLLSKTLIQILVVLLSLTILGVSIYGNIHLKQEFDPWSFLSSETPIMKWKDLHESSFPSKGEHVIIIFEGSDLLNLTKIEHLVNGLRNKKDIITDVSSWFTDFKSYYDIKYGDPPLLELSWTQVTDKLVQFLYSTKGAKFKYLFTFQEPLKCGGKMPKIITHIMEFDQVVISRSSKGIKAKNRVNNLFKANNFSTRVFPYSQLYTVWEIDEVIRGELYRNLGLATLAVYIATLLLMSNFKGSLFCLLLVVLTLTNVSGIMFFWGLTIDPVTCTVLIICIGLSVDFALHFVHAFLHMSINDAKAIVSIPEHWQSTNQRLCRNLRMRATLESIGPAVVHGGCSTLLAVVLMAFSDVYVFIAFFKIFALVVIFGLYNGLVLLPVLLVFCGPSDDQTSSAASLHIGHVPSSPTITPVPRPIAEQAGNKELL